MKKKLLFAILLISITGFAQTNKAKQNVVKLRPSGKYSVNEGIPSNVSSVVLKMINNNFY